MRASLLIALSALLTVACGPSRQEVDEQQRKEQDRRDLVASQKAEDKALIAACNSAYPSSDRRNNAVQYAVCGIDAFGKLHTRPDDLWWSVAYKRLELATKLSKGQITLEQYEAQYQEFLAAANTQREIRRNQAQVAQAAQLQALAAQEEANIAACRAAQEKEAEDNAWAQNANNSPASTMIAAGNAFTDVANVNRACNH